MVDELAQALVRIGFDDHQNHQEEGIGLEPSSGLIMQVQCLADSLQCEEERLNLQVFLELSIDVHRIDSAHVLLMKDR